MDIDKCKSIFKRTVRLQTKMIIGGTFLERGREKLKGDEWT